MKFTYAYFLILRFLLKNVLIMIRISLKIYSFFLLVFIAAGTLSGQPVYGFRGEDRTGVYKETGLLSQWPAGGPKLLWKVSGIGMGYSSATVTEDAIYITGVRSGKDVVTAFTREGKKKWDAEYGTILNVQNYPESRCTPTVSGGKIFLVSGSGELACVSTAGKILWKTNYYTKYQATVPRFGISESPLVVDNKVIVTPGGNIAAMVAFNVDNGNVFWETPSLREGTMYVNPLLIERSGKKIIVTHTSTWIIGVNAADGKILWKFDFSSVNDDKRGGKNYIQTPIYRDGYLFAANGYGQTAAKIRIFDDRDPELVWKNIFTALLMTIIRWAGGSVLTGPPEKQCGSQSGTIKVLS
jgi:outer membrane protein assembly factor BamB